MTAHCQDAKHIVHEIRLNAKNRLIYQGIKLIYLSFYNERLHNEIKSCSPLSYAHIEHINRQTEYIYNRLKTIYSVINIHIYIYTLEIIMILQFYIVFGRVITLLYHWDHHQLFCNTALKNN